MKHFTRLFLILMFISFGHCIQASENDGALRIIGSIGGGPSFNTGNFSGIPSVNTCCTTYPDAQGSLLELMLGLRMNTPLIEDKFSFQGSVQATISRFNAPFLTREFVGNFISGNTVTPALIDYSLALSGMMIGIEPRLHMHYSKLPISLFLGFNASSFLGSNANQTETIIEPNTAYFKNGSNVMNQYDGKISGLNSLLFSAIMGIEYQYAFQENLTIIPSISYRTYFNSFIESHPWKMNALIAGIGLSYTMPKKEKPIELPPPPPPPIEEKEPEITLSMHFHALLNDAMVEFGDTIPFPYERFINVKSRTIAPVYVFAHNSSEDIMEYAHEETFLEEAIKQNDAGLKILSISSDQESSEIAKARADNISKRLLAINPRRSIQTQTRVIKTKGLRYPELLDETRMVIVTNADGSLPIYKKTDTQIVFQETSIRLITEPSITGAKIAGMATLGNVKTMTIEEPDITFSFSPSFADQTETQKFIAQSFVTLEPNLKSKSRIELFIRPILLREKTNEQVSGADKEEYILGYSDFDDGKLSMIDPSVIERIKSALKTGITVSMIPLIDDLGKSDHNNNLAKERIISAQRFLEKELGKQAIQSILVSPPRRYQQNGKVTGRVLHRGISIRFGE